MLRHTMLLLAAGAIAGGCSRDAPLAPQAETVRAISEIPVTQAAVARFPDVLKAEGLNDALARLVPALDQYGVALQASLLKLKINRSETTARNELRRVLDQVASALPPEYLADFDALLLELDAAKD